jgi:hypothetical protein
VAEAISTLDFKRTEEPMLVISKLNTILATSGLEVLHLLEAELTGGGGLLALAGMDEDEPEKVDRFDPAHGAGESLLVHIGFCLPEHGLMPFSLRSAFSRSRQSIDHLRFGSLTSRSFETALRDQVSLSCLRLGATHLLQRLTFGLV